GRAPDGRARRDTPPRRAQRGGGAVAALVHSFGLRHDELHVLLGDGRRKPGLHRHASRRHEGTQMNLSVVILRRLRRRICCPNPGPIAAITLLATTAVAQTTPSVRLRAENTLAIARPDETLALKWSDVIAKLPQASPTKIRVIDPGTGGEGISQVVDNDGDGTMDELIFQATFAPGEAKAFVVEAAAATAKPAKARVYAAHMLPRDDVAWESDRIAYRIYGQGLWKVDSLLSSGVDVWVKRVRDPIVEKWYAKGHDEYHVDKGEGADFFDVGQSLGAGGTAIWKNDTLYRAWNFKSQRIIANGPIRAIFELYYQPWDAPGLRVTETKRIALDAGHNLNHVTTIFRAESGGPEIPWATGLVKRKNVVGLES